MKGISCGWLALVLAGCAAVGPDYEQPEIRTPDAWSEAISGQVAPGQASSLQTWWQVFNDPVLDDLIARAGKANVDLDIAMARVNARRAALAYAQGGKLPVITGGANASVEDRSDSETPLGEENRVEAYELGANLGWELDVFGRVRRSIEAAGAQYQASVEDYRDVMAIVFADVASSYITIRGSQQRIADAEANARSMAESLKLANERYDSGLSSRLDVLQAEANLEYTRASIPLLKITLEQSINGLAVLLGQDAGSLQSEFVETRPLPSAASLVAIGVPADVIRQRPDIRRAERQLAAQTAEVGVATADLYPLFNIGGFFGVQSDSLSDLFESSALSWGISSPVQWNIFNGGRVRNNIDLQNALLQLRLAEYRQQILKAIEEVENALAAYNLNRVRGDHLARATAASSEAVNLVLVQYKTGLTDFNNVLVSQRDLVSQQDDLVQTQTATELSLVALYRALGGGWNPAADIAGAAP
jgi:NodT family efflux transporter outer membrane factor (OMF) lipoprotein